MIGSWPGGAFVIGEGGIGPYTRGMTTQIIRRSFEVGFAVVAGAALALAGCDAKEEKSSTSAGAAADTGRTVVSEPAPQLPRPPVETGGMGQSGAPVGLPAMGSPVPQGAVAAVAGGERFKGEGISWVLPVGWTQREASGMRYATLVPAAGPEVSVTRLGGGGGGMLANVNRWRGQVFLPPLTEAELAASLKEVSLGGEDKASVVDIVGPKGRILGALIPVAGGQTWFFKAQVEQDEKMQPIIADFDTLVSTIKIGG